MGVVGVLKLSCALLLLVGVWFPAVTLPAALLLGLLMLGAVAMHFKAHDPWVKALPAFSLLVLCLVVSLG
jgi:hypothetical protein